MPMEIKICDGGEGCSHTRPVRERGIHADVLVDGAPHGEPVYSGAGARAEVAKIGPAYLEEQSFEAALRGADLPPNSVYDEYSEGEGLVVHQILDAPPPDENEAFLDDLFVGMTIVILVDLVAQSAHKPIWRRIDEAGYSLRLLVNCDCDGHLYAFRGEQVLDERGYPYVPTPQWAGEALSLMIQGPEYQRIPLEVAQQLASRVHELFDENAPAIDWAKVSWPIGRRGAPAEKPRALPPTSDG